MHWVTLDCGSVRIPVMWRERTHDEIVATKVGEFDASLCEIWIGSDLSRDIAKATLLHELGHALLYVYGVTVDDEDEEERWVNLISALAYDVLTRNGMLRLPEPPVSG